MKPSIFIKRKPTVEKSAEYTFIEVCAGCGGMSSGLVKAGFTPILLNEIDKVCCDTLRLNHPEVKIHQDSMCSLNLRGYHPDLLVGGMPCQSFSHAGKRLGLEDQRGQLLLDFKRLIDECNPRVFLIENVKGLATHNNGKTLREVIAYLEQGNNYNIVYRVLNAGHYGVPQKRERLIIVGVRRQIGIREFTFPLPYSTIKVLRDVLLDVPKSEGYSYPDSKKKVLDMVPPGGCWVNLPEEIKKEYMGASYFSGGGKRGIARRLSLDEQSLTLTTSPMQKQTERCHPLETRPFTIREYARIQSFPDTYVFCGSMANKYKQIGNAVPVQLAYEIGLSIRQFLSNAIEL